MNQKKLTKTGKEINIMKQAGKICAEALAEVRKNIKPGIPCIELDKIAEKEILKRGASPSFKTVDDYKWTICATINDQVVHGIPTEKKLKKGDIIGIDIGAMYEGYHSDLAISEAVGKISTENKKFLEVGKSTLVKAISKAQIGNRIGDISSIIQSGVEKAGYSVVKSLTGHGVGKELHEEPMIPGFGKKGTGMKLEKNMVLAIEVIYAKGSGEVRIEDDGWTISSKDHSLGGLFEQTVQLTKNGPVILTPYL
ncbi:type I methionyl aminopeptidase [Candidatus Curtissbacteria bacterium]|nr:type I methionyl aminopeptidase [Candidatus Curtissbacteria bacterium]